MNPQLSVDYISIKCPICKKPIKLYYTMVSTLIRKGLEKFDCGEKGFYAWCVHHSSKSVGLFKIGGILYVYETDAEGWKPTKNIVKVILI